MFGPYRKAIAGFVIPLIAWGYVVVDSPPAAPTAGEWMGLAVAVATGAGVYATRNKPA